jgi:exonuclease III
MLYTVCAMQVIAVGDFNIASEPRDVHSAITWDTLYAQSEMDALRQLTTTLTDTWRQLHPEQEGVYTVWDEKTSARAFNVVRGD